LPEFEGGGATAPYPPVSYSYVYSSLIARAKPCFMFRCAYGLRSACKLVLCVQLLTCVVAVCLQLYLKCTEMAIESHPLFYQQRACKQACLLIADILNNELICELICVDINENLM